MSQNLQNFAKFQKIQLDNLVDFEKCCQTHIYLQNFVLIQPKTSNILPKFCQKLASKRPSTTDGGHGRGVVRGRLGRKEVGVYGVRFGLSQYGYFSLIGKISKILRIFGGLVLGCIKTKLCKKICV